MKSTYYEKIEINHNYTTYYLKLGVKIKNVKIQTYAAVHCANKGENDVLNIFENQV